MAGVRILNGPNQDQLFVLRGGEMVGRDPANAIRVFAPGVSRRHFCFKNQEGAIWVEDMGSSNGTYVNNQRIDKHRLRHGETITVGGINMRFVEDDEAAALGSSQEEVQLGAYGITQTGTTTPIGQRQTAPVVAGPEQVVLKEEEEESAGEDYAMDASIVFDPKAVLPVEDKVQALQKRLSIMFEISQALGELQTLQEMCDKIMDELFAVFPQADRGFILTGSSVDDLKPVVVRHRRDGKAEVQISRTIARKILDGRQAILSQNAMEDDRFSGGMSILNFRILSMAAAPMLFRDEVFGLVHLDTQDRTRKFTPDDLNLMAGIAAQAGTFIKNLKLNEAARKEAEARANLERYFSPVVANRVASGEIDLKLGGDMKEGTVFFSDIIGFTSMSEHLNADQVVARINRYMRYMVDIVFKYNGSVDKFIGDCIMAVWGVPLPMEDDAVAGISAAVEMQNALYLFNLELQAEGSPPIHMGIGLNSGSFVAGNMGSERRMEYTVIGDNVNLAQRIESKSGRGMVLVAPSTWENARERVIACRLKPAALKGKAKPIETYCVRGIEEPRPGAGKVYMTSIPVAINAWTPDCERGLVVKVRLEPGSDKVLGLVLLPKKPTQPRLKLEVYAPEMPRCTLEMDVQSEVKIQAPHGVCMKGTFSLKGTPLDELFQRQVYVSDKSPDDIPRATTPI